jgi:beta-galactosidase
VRTSHYPQSHHFIDECDRLGLLVFTEIPGWQHIGDESWQDQAVENVQEMVLQYRNHPSIILWGVRINESQDNDTFYLRTNALAHELDPSRPTTGVRFFTTSHLLEDVYALNDFSHNGLNAGCRTKEKSTTDPSKALLITEHSGHMFPTKAFDNWSRRQEHALRHARVLNDAYATGLHAGCIGWCMFDYVTHKECGSGDRVCYHGVLDTFRNPKLAAALYASQQDATPVLAVGSHMDLGDYSSSCIGDVYAFTNADSVRLYKNGVLLGEMSSKAFPALPHSPILLDPMGDQLTKAEGYTDEAAQLLHRILAAQKVEGPEHPSEKTLESRRIAEEKYGIVWDEISRLYGKYIGGWGDRSMCWKVEGLQNGKVVSTVDLTPNTGLHLEVKVSKTQLQEQATYDMAAVRVRLLDDDGNPTVYAQLPVIFSLEGAAELVGPNVVTAEGGMCGTYIRTIGTAGTIKLTVSTAQTAPVTVELSAQLLG